MRGLLVVGGFLLVGLIGIWGVLNLAVSRADDIQQRFTMTPAEVVRTGTEPEDNFAFRNYKGFRVSYSYRVGEDWYAGSQWFGDSIGVESLIVCALPEDPAEHYAAQRFDGDERCGGTDFSGNVSQQGSPTRAPALTTTS